MNSINLKKKYSLFKIRIRIEKNFDHFNPFSFVGNNMINLEKYSSEFLIKIYIEF